MIPECSSGKMLCEYALCNPGSGPRLWVKATIPGTSCCRFLGHRHSRMLWRKETSPRVGTATVAEICEPQTSSRCLSCQYCCQNVRKQRELGLTSLLFVLLPNYLALRGFSKLEALFAACGRWHPHPQALQTDHTH